MQKRTKSFAFPSFCATLRRKPHKRHRLLTVSAAKSNHMCGIAGFFSKGPFEGFESNWIGNMLDVISYRGPDESDFVADNKRGIALGANRLALVDLVTGRQPLVSDTSSDTTFLTSETAKNDQSLFLAVNGEFYGFKALRASLMARGYTFSH